MTKPKRIKPFEKGHLKNNTVSLYDAAPKSRHNAGVQGARARARSKEKPINVTLNWKAPSWTTES